MDYEPFPWQEVMHRSAAKGKWVQAGRRSGKTRGGLAEGMTDIERVSKTPVIARDGHTKQTAREAMLVPDIHVWTVAPTKANMRQIWNEMQAFIPKNLVVHGNPMREDGYSRGGGRGGGWKEDDLYVWLQLPVRDETGRIRWRRNVFWELKSADNPEMLQTVGLDVLHISEAQDCKEDAWIKVRPTLNSPHRAGKAIVEGIPPISAQHWFARWYKQAKEKPGKYREAFHAAYTDNPFLTADDIAEIEEDRANMTVESWERLYLAKQPEGHGQFFKRIMDAAGALGAMEIGLPVEARFYVAGLDLGRSNDPTVLIVKDRQSRASVWAVELLRTDWGLQVETLKAEARRWGLEQIYMDATGMGGQFAEDVLYRELLMENIPVVGFNFTPQKKYQLFVDYAIALEKGTVGFPANWTKLASQLEDIAHRDTANRGHHFFSVSGGHDDWVDAECLALMACDPAMVDGEEYTPSESMGGIMPMRPNTSSRRNGRLANVLRAVREERHPDVELPDLIVNGEPMHLN